jgi:alpha-L-rhamnosidase
LTAGSNVAGVNLGNGRFFAPRLKVSHIHKKLRISTLLFQLVIDYAMEQETFIISDKNWKVTDNGPIRANNEYDGEEYDARMELTGWRFPPDTMIHPGKR